MVREYKARGIKTAVLDPLCDPAWGADFQTDNPEEFLRVMYESEKLALFVDESGTAIGRFAGEMQKLATQSRHFGHKCHFFTQRGVQLDRTVRDQCSTLFIFRVGKNDAKTFAEEFGYEELKKCNELKQGECFKLTRFSPPQKINIFV